MLDSFLLLKNFKYSFIALLAFCGAIILNILFVFKLSSLIIFIVIFCIITIFLLKFSNITKTILTLSLFFLIGLLSSGIYNSYFRVFPLSNAINDEKAWLKGEVYEIKINDKYAKIYIKNPKIYSDLLKSLDYNKVPNIIISTFSSRITDLKVGDTLTTKAMLEKPQEQAFADDFNYAEYLLQNKINLTGQVRGGIYISPPEKYSIFNKIQNFRLNTATKINKAYNNQLEGAISTALITGYRGFVDYNVKQDFIKSGLAHLMAISGMHMAFLAGIIFLLIRYLICLIPAIALNYNSKKIAAIVTIIFSFGYLLLAGSSLPTTRAFLMVLIFSLTMLIDRNKIALHTLCVIAMLILAFDPMAIFSASFQLSFSAVFAMLIYNQIKQHELIINYSLTAKVMRNLANTVNISIIAFTATMFFVALHFKYISIFSIFANIIASILMAFIVMPILFLFFIGYVLLDISFFKTLNQESINLLYSVAKYFANFQQNSVYIPTEYAFFLLIIGLAIIAVISFDFSRKYIISTLLFFVAFIIPLKFDLRPKIINFETGLGLRQENKLITLGNIDKNALRNATSLYKVEPTENNLTKTCDISGCIYKFNEKTILEMNAGFNYSTEDTNLVDYFLK